MTDAEKQTKFLNYAGLEHFIELLVNHGFADKMGLSQENFTSALKAKYDALAAASSVEDLTALFTRVEALEKLIDADSDQTINKFNEIVEFLAGIDPSGDGLASTLADIATQIADAKKAGTDAQTALNSYKTANDTALAGKVDKVTGKGLSTNDYTTAEKNLVATINNKVDAVAGKGLSTNDYTTAEKNLVAKINNKLDSSDLQAVTVAEIDALVGAGA